VEFVSAGGLSMKERASGTVMSRKVPGLFVVGEANDVDAVTGGYNFLNCWVSGHVAGKSAGKFVGGLE
jgi:predicted flavoprotein YhiN